MDNQQIEWNADVAINQIQNTITDAGTVERNCNNEKRTKLLLECYNPRSLL
jgi:hypothetical protein